MTQNNASHIIDTFLDNGINHFWVNAGAPVFPLALDIASKQQAGEEIHQHRAVTETGGAFAALGYNTDNPEQPAVVMGTQMVAIHSGFSSALHSAAKQHIPFIAVVANASTEQERGTPYGFQQGGDMESVAKSTNAEFVHIGDGDDINAKMQEAITLAKQGKAVLLELGLTMLKAENLGHDSIAHDTDRKPQMINETDRGELLRAVPTSIQKPIFVLGQGYANRRQELKSQHQEDRLDTELKELAKRTGAAVANDSSAMGQYDFSDEHFVGMMGRVRPQIFRGAESDNRESLFNLTKGEGEPTRILLGAEPDSVLDDYGQDNYFNTHNFVMVHPDKELLDFYQSIYTDTMTAVHADVDEAMKVLGNQEYTTARSNTVATNAAHQELVDHPEQWLMYPEFKHLQGIADAVEFALDGQKAEQVFDGGITANQMSYLLMPDEAAGSMVVAQHAVGTAHRVGVGKAMSEDDANTPVIVHIGDGGMHYGMAQLAEHKNTERPLIVMVYNDGEDGHTAVSHGIQQRYGSNLDMDVIESTANLPETSFADIARAHGLKGVSVDDDQPLKIKEEISKAINLGGITIIDVNMHTPSQLQHVVSTSPAA